MAPLRRFMSKDYTNISSQLFCAQRLTAEDPITDFLTTSLSATDGDFGLERDHLKTVLTAPLRRLQHKTQVFPLDVTSSARSRLTHSLETAEYARLIIFFLVRQAPDFAPFERQMTLCVSTAALLHDVGNPPFGHFGEAVIRRFLHDLCARCDNMLTDAQKIDLKAFNGNAQGLRIVHSIQGLNLSLGQLASMIKVPFTAPMLQRRGLDPIHAGVFLSEKLVLTAINTKWPLRQRHPLSLVMELADDVAYSLADLEDAADKGLVPADSLLQLLEKLSVLCKVDLSAFVPSRQAFFRAFATSRRTVLNALREVLGALYVKQCAQALGQNAATWLTQGTIDLSALPACQAVQELKRFEMRYVYAASEVESLELTGAAYLQYLLHAYGQMTQVPYHEFARIIAGSGGDPYLLRLCHRISRRHLQAYQVSVRQDPASELYARIRLILDYISGMTDTYAGAEYRLLSAGS